MLLDELKEIEKQGARERAAIRKNCDVQIANIRQQRDVKLAEMEAEHKKQMEQLKEEHEAQMKSMENIREQISKATAAKDFQKVQELFKELMSQMKA